ncbi:TolC family outer membrane protein [Aquabacterium sp. CECT 9606]|uniref:TolC family outer membrane protein n=1 Tax=Aquabacterium sp. CECT 9606 TaxID=2845822 RepID=UPI001E346D09|nr:TolC family outer membrane protein [Aquabacterium sp. CECT 9606]
MALAAFAFAAQAQTQTAPTAGLGAAAQKAIDGNPEVTARLNALRAATDEISVARGGYLPRVDLSASVGRDSDRITNRNPDSQSLNRNGVALSANQVLWDGLQTRREVERLGHAKLTRYFEFLSATEEAALEASRAYIDVQRYRRLVELAQDNYVQHRYVQDQLQSKVKAGVGRGVDSEQATARLALADSNLTTEAANLHDVSARYLRVVGEAPANDQPAVQGLDKGIPSSSEDTTNQAVLASATVEAAVENLRAAKAQASGQKSNYQPKVEARVRSGVGKNFDGIETQKRDTSAEILMSWNLYNGGSDQARARQLANLVNQAADQRDKACRDVRQTASIAHNDIQKLKDQLTALDRNVLAIEKARDAYRQQFDIGQRSLLDLLNSENELYTAKRAYVNAEADLQLAYARTHAAKNSLTANLGLNPSAATDNENGQNWQAAEDAAQRCPAISIEAPTINREELNDRARKLGRPAAAGTAAVATTTASAPALPAIPTVTERLRGWAMAWAAKDIARYMGFYAKDFAPARSTSAKWINERRRLLAKPGPIEVQLSQVKAEARGDAVVTSFTQNYTSQNFKDSSFKALTWKLIDGQWVIVNESNR